MPDSDPLEAATFEPRRSIVQTELFEPPAAPSSNDNAPKFEPASASVRTLEHPPDAARTRVVSALVLLRQFLDAHENERAAWNAELTRPRDEAAARIAKSERGTESKHEQALPVDQRTNRPTIDRPGGPTPLPGPTSQATRQAGASQPPSGRCLRRAGGK